MRSNEWPKVLHRQWRYIVKLCKIIETSVPHLHNKNIYYQKKKKSHNNTFQAKEKNKLTGKTTHGVHVHIGSHRRGGNKASCIRWWRPHEAPHRTSLWLQVNISGIPIISTILITPAPMIVMVGTISTLVGPKVSPTGGIPMIIHRM
jgi:hypothetical protein